MLKPAIDELLVTFDAVFTYFVSIGKRLGHKLLCPRGEKGKRGKGKKGVLSREKVSKRVLLIVVLTEV